MNKRLYFFRNVFYIINVLFTFSFLFQLSNLPKVNEYICLCIIMIAFSILLIKNQIDKDKIRNDKKYNFVFLISNLMILIIFLRNYFDLAIPTGLEQSLSQYYQTFFWDRNTFFIYNISYIIIIIVGLFGYNVLMKKSS